jgi:hypothetical protein
VENVSPELDDMPFLKRWPYRCEEEFRILWEGETNRDSIEVDIDLKSINKITLSQKMPVAVTDSIKELLRREINDPSRKINVSTLYQNRRWITAFKG